MSRGDIRDVWVGPLSAEKEPIRILDYDPDWPRLFAREEKRIRGVLGDRVLGLEHVGSTAVPGLPAKPRIDIDLTVADSGDEGAYLPPRLTDRSDARLFVRCSAAKPG